MYRLTCVILLATLLVWSLGGGSGSPNIAYYVAFEASQGTDLTIEGHEVQNDTFITHEGTRPIVRTAAPVLRIPTDHVTEVRVHEVAEPGQGSPRTWTVARLTFSEEYRTRIDQLYSLYPDYYLLLRLNESLVDLEALGAYPSEGFPGGVFRSLEEARDAYNSAGMSLSVVKSLPGEIEERERFEREYRAAALWFAKCDPDTFAELRDEGIETFIGPVGAQEGWDQIDCDQEPPQFPPSPPGRPEVCTPASENGSLKGAERDGVWSILNPYGQQIRLDYYRDGELVKSVWLRDCGSKSRR